MPVARNAIGITELAHWQRTLARHVWFLRRAGVPSAQIEREIELRGDRFGERVTLDRPNGVVFERTFGPVLGTIHNDILEEPPGELSLRFSFDLVLEGVTPGSAEEREYQDTMSQDYLKAVDATLAAIRRWVREGLVEVSS